MKTNEVVTLGMQLKKLLLKKYEPIMKEYELRAVEFEILFFLYENKSYDTAKDIIQNTYFSKAHVSKSIDKLKSGGFIQITEDEADHRILHICLKDKSKDVISKVISICEECRDIMQRNINEDELEAVKNIMRKMTENINNELEE